MIDLQPVPLTKAELIHFALIDELFAKKDTVHEIEPPSERKVQTTKELQKQLINSYEVKHYLTIGTMSWEDYLYEIGVITYEQFKAYNDQPR